MASNKNVKLMRGAPENAIKHLAWPIMLSMILTTLYNIIDGIWVAGLGQSAIAGIGFVTPIFMILNGVSVGLGVGATSIISRYVGAKSRKNASNAAIHSIFIFIIASVALTILLIFIQKPVLMIYGASGQSLNDGLKYSNMLFLGLFSFIFANGGSGILRGEGDMKRALYAVIVSVILNAILDPIFIYSLNLKTAGAGLASVLSALGASIVIFYWILIKKDTYVDVSLGKFTYDKSITMKILKVGIPASLELFIIGISVAFYLSFLTSIAGDFGVASYSSGMRLYLFAIMPLTAIGSAVVAVSGSAYGAKNREYLSRTHIFGSKFASLFGLAITIVFLLFSNQLATIFAYTPETAILVPTIAKFLRIAGLAFFFTGMGMVSSSIYQGLGKGIISLTFIIFREIIFTVPLTYFFSIYLSYGLDGIWMGLALGRSIVGLINFIAARYAIKRIILSF